MALAFLKARSVQNMIAFLAKEAGISHEVWPHLMRHSYITHALRRNVNVVALQHIVGWSSLAILKNYEHLNASDSYQAMLQVLGDE